MLRDFFASPNFLALLRFWDSARVGRAVPEWTGDATTIPDYLRQRLIVVERQEGERQEAEAQNEGLIYRYLGSFNKKQFGRDPTGQTVAATLSGEYAAYLTDLTDAVLGGAAPVFSCSIL